MRSSFSRTSIPTLGLLLLTSFSSRIQAQNVTLTASDFEISYGRIPETAQLSQDIDKRVGPGKAFSHVLVVHFDGHYLTSNAYVKQKRDAEPELPRDHNVNKIRIEVAEINHKSISLTVKELTQKGTLDPEAAKVLIASSLKNLEEARKLPFLTLAKKNVFATFMLPQMLLPESYNFNESSPRVIGTIDFRYYDQDRAPHTLATLFGCNTTRGREKIAKTYLIGTGNSHGGHALDVFASRLKKLCGKELDLAVFGDAVAQPFWKSKKKLKSKFLAGRCYSFYQRNSKVVNGDAIEGCKNFLVANHTPDKGIVGFVAADHGSVADIPKTWVDFSLMGLK